MEDKDTQVLCEATPWYFYVMALLFCTVFVVCITAIVWKLGIWWLMFFYILPVVCFSGL